MLKDEKSIFALIMTTQNQYKFTEGEIHTFKITGYTEIPGTDESFFILENQFGGKHLLKSHHYEQYNLTVGEGVVCKIDKINCSGKIYLEPENPFYKPGNTYEFDVEATKEQINSVGEKENVVVVKDRFGNDTTCSLPPDFDTTQLSNKIKCKVLRIKKGQLFLSIPEYDEAFNKLKIGEKYYFTIEAIKPLKRNIEYYILKDEFENRYSLKKDMYEHYGFGIGQKVQCFVTKFNVDGHLKIEPVHPHYEIGKTYPFKFSKIKKEFDPLKKEEYVIVVEDIFGIETNVRSNKIHIESQLPETLYCKVEGIRKGKAILSY